MFVELNFKSGKPAYLQIVDQIKGAAASGRLAPGEALPSIRALAEELRINRNTVAKAFGELEHQGIVRTLHGKGVFLSTNPTPYGEAVQKEILSEAIDAAIVQAHHFQVSDEGLLDLVRERLTEFEKRREKKEREK
ncbi:MAG: GntR family transcriptional regulator [Candidatus Omnitrophica bacterium]|nr:GntR family transcriptional regulator [Candidatus Omnitrophota bacterium]